MSFPEHAAPAGEGINQPSEVIAAQVARAQVGGALSDSKPVDEEGIVAAQQELLEVTRS